MTGHRHDGGGGLRWLLTYADMITLLLAFFIVLYASSRVDTRRYTDVVSSIRVAFGVPPRPRPIVQAGHGGTALLPFPDMTGLLVQQLSAHVEEEIKAGSVEIERTEKGAVLRFQDSVLFGLGSAMLSDDAKRILDKIARPLLNTPYAIEVEGHTDPLPIRSSSFPSNWELSVARATAVIRYLVAAHHFSPTRLAAKGMAENQPLVPNDPAHGNPRNRRVELHLLAS
ncbi:MAG: chemotaxis protein MotB [Candidatus Methylomirabilota bacterium]|nr:OmpA family protein [Candidatus Methylomirabilis sp.]NJD69417.1 chemotaxis protein MotB [candidate division NC10 bacterium]PWB43514.1 MAG: chemotaxis protein MotB [candidate division NC10 bacterium]